MNKRKPRLCFSLRTPVKADYRDLSDRDLIVASQKHDDHAFTVIYQRYSRYVRGIVFRLSPDWQSSHDDMVQEVFLRVWKSLNTLQNPLAFKTWLNRLITNMFYDELRRRPRFCTVPLDRPATTRVMKTVCPGTLSTPNNSQTTILQEKS